MVKNIQILFIFIICLTAISLAQPSISFNPKTDFTTGKEPGSFSINDLNSDGKLDFVITCDGDTSISVLLNTTSQGSLTPSFSTKTDFVTGRSPYSVAVGDLNIDGKPDLVVANAFDNNVSVYLNTTPAGSLTPSFSTKTDFGTGAGPTDVSIADLNNDGKPDLVVADQSTNRVSVLLNTTFSGATSASFSTKTDFVAGSTPFSVSIGDLNSDNKPDFAIANFSSKNVSIFLNTTNAGASTPSFTTKVDLIAGNNPQSVFIKDLNGDNKPDLVVSNNNDNSVSVFLNTTTSGSLTPIFSAKTDFVTDIGPEGVSVGDLNGDSKPDIAVANSNSANVSVFLNTTNTGATTPTFLPKTDFATGVQPGYVSIGDLNMDGKPDLAATNYNFNSISVLINTTNITGIDEEKNIIISDYRLTQNYPNPFNPTTVINYSLPTSGFVSLKVYDVLGKYVKTIVKKEQAAGAYKVMFDASDLSSGIYLYRLEANRFVSTKKMLLLK